MKRWGENKKKKKKFKKKNPRKEKSYEQCEPKKKKNVEYHWKKIFRNKHKFKGHAKAFQKKKKGYANEWP